MDRFSICSSCFSVSFCGKRVHAASVFTFGNRALWCKRYDGFSLHNNSNNNNNNKRPGWCCKYIQPFKSALHRSSTKEYRLTYTALVWKYSAIVSTHTYNRGRARAHTHTHTHTHTHSYISTHMHARMHMHTHTQTHAHAHARAHTHTHTHTQRNFFSSSFPS